MVKIFGREIPPPFKKNEEQAEQGFSLAEVPAPFDTGTLLEAAMHDESELVRQELDEYHGQWNKYATDRNLYHDESVRSMWSACLEAVELAAKVGTAEPAAQKELVASLREKLKEIRGPLAEQIERKAAEHQEWIENNREATHKEHKDGLAETVSALEMSGPVIASKELGDSKIPEDLELSEDQIHKEPSENQKKAAAAVEQEKKQVEETEAAYLEAYKEFYSQKGSKEGDEPEELKALKQQYLESRVAYADALTKSAADRLQEREVKGGVIEGENFNYQKSDVLARYNRLIRYKEVIKPAAEKQYQARLDALDAKGKGLFKKSLDWAVGKNANLEKAWGKKGARLIRALAVTTVAGGVGVAAGTVGAVGVLGFAGWGAARIAKSLLINSPLAGLAGMATGEVAGLGFKTLQNKAKGQLAYEGRDADPLTVDDLLHFDENRMRLEKSADERTLQQRKMVARVIGALVAGAGISAFEHLGEVAVSHAASETVSGPNPPLPPSAPAAAPATSPGPGGAVHVAEPTPQEPQHMAKVEQVKTHTPEPVHHTAPQSHSAPTEETQPVENEPTVETEAPEQFPDVKPLPEGVDQNSPEATAYLNRAYNPEAFESTPSEPATAVEVPDATPVAEPAVEPVAPIEAPAPESAAPIENVQAPDSTVAEPAYTEPSDLTQPSVPSEPQTFEQPAPSADVTGTIDQAVPQHVEAPDIVAVDHSVGDTNAVEAAPEHEAAPESMEQPALLNPNGFDLSHTAVGADSKGNAFVHLVSTGDLEQDNDAAYDTALKFAQTHHETPVYFTQQTQNIFGIKSSNIFALKYNEGTTNWNYHPDEMPQVPTDTDYKPIT